MSANRLKAPDVAEILNRETITVRIWRCEDTKRVIPEDALRILRMETAAKAPA